MPSTLDSTFVETTLENRIDCSERSAQNTMRRNSHKRSQNHLLPGDHLMRSGFTVLARLVLAPCCPSVSGT